MMHYAGIGTRGPIPKHIEQYIDWIGQAMASQGVILRSGGADGCDTLFEQACDKINPDLKEIFLPAKGFNGNKSPLFNTSPESYDYTAQFHPAWDRLGKFARDCMARNSNQVLGAELNAPVVVVFFVTLKMGWSMVIILPSILAALGKQFELPLA